MSLIVVIAILNLALGFGLASLAGRGPWPLRRNGRFVAAWPRPRGGKKKPVTLTQLVDQIRRLEVELETQIQAAKVDGASAETIQQLLQSIDGAMEELQAVTLSGTSAGAGEQQLASGLGSLLVTLQAARDDLQTNLPDGPFSDLRSIDDLLAACRDARQLLERPASDEGEKGSEGEEESEGEERETESEYESDRDLVTKV